ncbi:hypothetical protein BKN14_00895 [Candidatus Gracilibacteria bacterium HOT-871]|nr:hypothetical protein BKN14_00895 [Candidatus Gracilibacteria bacterium HOT-871]
MLSLSDFDEKQILFIESFDTKNINFENENLVIKENSEIKNKVSMYKIFAIFLIGETTITSVLIRKFQEFGITLVLMKKNFLSYLVIGNETEGNFVLRKKQYEKTEEQMLEIAKNIIKIKAKNQLELLKNFRNKSPDLKENILKIENIYKKIDFSENYDSLLGYEGNISKIFFQNYFLEIGWVRRAPRTKFDIKNLLLDIGYTYLFHFVEAMLRLYGFDNYYGVYHRTWYQRKSLALDLMEPFRCIIDKALLKSYNLGQINEKDFAFRNGQYVLEWKNSRKYNQIFFKEILNYKLEIFSFVKEYYKYFMKGKSTFPNFEIIKK